MEDVLKVIEEREWELSWTCKTYGYFLSFLHSNRGRVSDGTTPYEREAGTSVEIGKQSIRIHLGSFRMIFAFAVDIYYAFDEDSKLIDVAIRREMDVL